MLKKALNIVLVMLLLVSTTGVTFYKHYCSGSLVSKSVVFPAKKCCDNHCKGCHNDNKTYKITDNFEANNSLTLKNNIKELAKYVLLSFTLFSENYNYFAINKIHTTFKFCSPPPLIAENTSVLLQVFRL